MSIKSIITRVRSGAGNREDWLFVANVSEGLTLDSDAALGSVEFDNDSGEEIIPAEFKKRGLQCTIDYQTVQDCITWADRLSGSQDDLAVADVLRYYIRFDAYPNQLSAPDPPSRKEMQATLDREFYDRLGPEDSSLRCQREGCTRGTVKFSVLCRPHHFESILKRPSPFDH